MTGNQIGLPIKHDFLIVNDAYIKQKEITFRKYGIEVGDEKRALNFFPQLKTKVFDNRANFSVRYNTVADNIIPTVEDEEIVWQDDYTSVRFGDSPKGYNMGLVLKHKPASRYVEYTIESKGLIFLKEVESDEALAKELGVSYKELKEGRPDNVTRSMSAWYDKDIADISRKEFQTGKAFHIYRPFLIDSKGNSCYGEIDIVSEKLIVEIPKQFHKNAKYPVMIDPTEV